MSKNKNSKPKTALLWDLSGAFVKQFSSFFISILLARLLGPEKIGIIAMSMVFVNISTVLTDVGFPNALVQQKETKDIAFSSVFYINLGLSLVLALIIFLSAPFIANYYEEPIVETVVKYLAVIPPISALGSVQATILTKRIDFKSLTIRDVVATTVAGILGVIAAFSGLGVFSLVIQQIAMVVLGTILLWFSTGWRPKFEFSKEEIKQLFSYSSYVFLDNLIRRVSLNINTIFIGKVFSPATLGFYSKAESLKSQVQTYSTNSLNKVIFPVFSKLQDDEKSFKKTYFRAFNIISGLIVLLIAPLFFLSNFIITTLLGEEWRQSVVLFQILILSAIVSPHIGMMSKALLAKGFSKLRFKVGLIQRLLMLLPIVFGLLFGIKEFAMGIVGASFAIFVLFLLVVDKKLNISFKFQFKNILVPSVVFIIFMALYYFFRDSNISEWEFVVYFMIAHFIYIKWIGHESFSFLVDTIRSLVKRGNTT